MAYLWLKALHVAAVVIWIGGLLIAAIILRAFSVHKETTEMRGQAVVLDVVRRWDRRVTSPAMLLVWGLGITLATQGGWFRSPWMMIKLGLVLLLSAVHAVLSGWLRKPGRVIEPSMSRRLRYAPLLVIACVSTIIVLVIVKPI
jgi:uncharacterized membrane protein